MKFCSCDDLCQLFHICWFDIEYVYLMLAAETAVVIFEMQQGEEHGNHQHKQSMTYLAITRSISAWLGTE